jgi:hypothetical protein
MSTTDAEKSAASDHNESNINNVKVFMDGTTSPKNDEEHPATDLMKMT